VSRKLLAFLLSELKTIRILCRQGHCQGVIELPLADLAKGHGKCPICSNAFNPLNHTLSKLTLFAQHLRDIQEAKEVYEVELILPDESDK